VTTEILVYEKAGAVMRRRVAQDEALNGAYTLFIHLQETS